VLLLSFDFQKAQGCKIVLHLLESRERSLAVICDRGIVFAEAMVRTARRRPASKSVSEKVGPTAQKRLGQVNQFNAEVPCSPATALKLSVG